MIFYKRKVVECFEFPQSFDCRYTLLIVMSVISLVSFAAPVYSQQSAKNAIYIEVASKGPVYSINYDHIIRQGEKLVYSFRAGFSIEKNAVSFPVGLNFITGLNDHHAEFSLTIIPYIDYVDKNSGSNNDQTDKYIFINPAIGYRFQKASGSIFLKAAVGPSIFLDPPSNDFWNMNPKLYAFGSIGVGISF